MNDYIDIPSGVHARLRAALPARTSPNVADSSHSPGASAILASVEKTSESRMKTLRSYLGGRWVEGSGTPQTLVNPATEERLAQVASDGADLAAALDHARRKGGP